MLYIVRWPNLSVALVEAYDEDHLVDILDEVGNVDTCTWQVYDGPLFLDLNLRADASLKQDTPPDRPSGAQDLFLEDVDDLRNNWRDPLVITWAPSETGMNTRDAIMRFAFPHTTPLLDTEEPPDINFLEVALRKDAQPLIAGTWRTAQLHHSDDPLAPIARTLGMPIAQVRRWLGEAADREE